MEMKGFDFATTDWSTVPVTEHPGATGKATWRTLQFGDIRVRLVEYSPGYLADHWCKRGHVILLLGGELDTELDDGRSFALRKGMTYVVASDREAHRSSTRTGASLFIVD
jgi:hypothetical protein